MFPHPATPETETTHAIGSGPCGSTGWRIGWPRGPSRPEAVTGRSVRSFLQFAGRASSSARQPPRHPLRVFAPPPIPRIVGFRQSDSGAQSHRAPDGMSSRAQRGICFARHARATSEIPRCARDDSIHFVLLEAHRPSGKVRPGLAVPPGRYRLTIHSSRSRFTVQAPRLIAHRHASR